MSEQDDLATKAKDISTALGISNEPPKLNESHVGVLDDLHDAIGETKTSMQTKGNYVSSTHLSSAQRHLQDAKAVLGTKALNVDTKHVLAKAAIGRASASLTNATREAAAPDKAKVFGHNSDLKAFVSNPDGSFAKMNENHDDHGRFASGDGSGSSSDSNSASGDKNALASIAVTENSVGQAYVDAHNAQRTSGQPATPAMMDMYQAHEDGLSHLQDAKASISQGNYSAARDSLNYAAKGFDQSSTFAGAAADMRGMASYYGSFGKSLDFDNSKEIQSIALGIQNSSGISKSLGLFKKYAVNPDVPESSAQEKADVAECVAIFDDLRQEAATALSYEKDQDRAKELAELVNELTYRSTYIKDGSYTWAKSTADSIGQAVIAKLGDAYVQKLETLRTKLHDLDDKYPNHY